VEGGDLLEKGSSAVLGNGTAKLKIALSASWVQLDRD